jgi:hypothetical protein
VEAMTRAGLVCVAHQQRRCRHRQRLHD